MFRWIRAIMYSIAGWFGKKTDRLYESASVQAATYDKAIDTSKERFEHVRNAVAELMQIEQTRISEIKQLHDREEKLAKVQTGAQAAMQRRINTLKGLKQADGTPHTKESMQKDAEFIKHEGAYKDAKSTLAEVQSRIAEKEADLATRKTAIGNYEKELQRMQRAVKKLTEEKSETLADTAIAAQQEAINATLAGITADTTDEDLAKVRGARDRVKARATLTGRLVGADAEHAENEYLALADSTAVDKDLDTLLDWGESETSAALKDAQLPETP